MKTFFVIAACFFLGIFSAQRNLTFDSLKLKEVRDFFVDDYGNVYLFKNKDLSFTKYDSLGKQVGQMMLNLPFKVQNVQNPLNIAMFSENAQEMKFVDQNLNEIQKIEFTSKFGLVKMVYSEDLQQIWILDNSTKLLIQYNFRDERIINSFPLNFNFDEIIDMIVFENKLYLLTKNSFKVFNFKSEQLYEAFLSNPKKLRRENNYIFVISKNNITKFRYPEHIQVTFSDKDSQIVDKNSLSYFELKDNKLYLYNIENR